jgi:hypothetical protein
MGYDFLISEVKALDEKIRQVGVYHNHARILEICDDVAGYFAQGHVEVQQNNSVQLLARLPKNAGRQFHYAMAKFDDVVLYVFALSEHDLLLLSTDPDANSDLVISRVLDFLRH